MFCFYVSFNAHMLFILFFPPQVCFCSLWLHVFFLWKNFFNFLKIANYYEASCTCVCFIMSSDLCRVVCGFCKYTSTSSVNIFWLSVLSLYIHIIISYMYGCLIKVTWKKLLSNLLVKYETWWCLIVTVATEFHIK